MYKFLRTKDELKENVMQEDTVENNPSAAIPRDRPRGSSRAINTTAWGVWQGKRFWHWNNICQHLASVSCDGQPSSMGTDSTAGKRRAVVENHFFLIWMGNFHNKLESELGNAKYFGKAYLQKKHQKRVFEKYSGSIWLYMYNIVSD